MIYLPDVLQTLSFIRGETTPPSTTAAQRTEFVQDTLKEIYEAYPWKFAQLNAVVTLVSGLATLPSGLSQEHQINIQYESTPGNNLTEVEMNEININDRFNSSPGDNAFWLTPIGDQLLFNTRNLITSIKVIGQSIEPTINATIGTPFPDKMTVALGANRWVIKAQNPEADISQDEDLYQNRLSDNIGTTNRNQRRRGVRTAQSESGSSTGDI